MVLHALHLCSGYGGFELALRHAGIDARTVAHVERDSYAAATLVARMAESRVDQAPIWSDLFTFDAAAWSGRVDLITAGFPCQPFSPAGRRLGVDDDRHIWPRIADIIGDVRPRYVLLENVRGVVRAVLPHVLADLARLGFNAEWGVLPASAIGAPHRRERWWCLAYTDGPGRSEIAGRLSGDETETQRDGNGHVADGGREDVADTPTERRDQRIERGESRRLPPDAQAVGSDVGHTPSIRRSERQRPDPHQREGRSAHPQESGHIFPPRPNDRDGWDQWQGAQPAIHRGTDGATEWLADALHLGGNGLVPQCAAEALRQLADRARDVAG